MFFEDEEIVKDLLNACLCNLNNVGIDNVVYFIEDNSIIEKEIAISAGFVYQGSYRSYSLIL